MYTTSTDWTHERAAARRSRTVQGDVTPSVRRVSVATAQSIKLAQDLEELEKIKAHPSCFIEVGRAKWGPIPENMGGNTVPSSPTTKFTAEKGHQQLGTSPAATHLQRQARLQAKLQSDRARAIRRARALKDAETSTPRCFVGSRAGSGANAMPSRRAPSPKGAIHALLKQRRKARSSTLRIR